jgi:hypothetical protein
VSSPFDALSPGLMLRSIAKRCVSKHEAARMLQQRGRYILRDAILRIAPQDEAGREPESAPGHDTE